MCTNNGKDFCHETVNKATQASTLDTKEGSHVSKNKHYNYSI